MKRPIRIEQALSALMPFVLGLAACGDHEPDEPDEPAPVTTVPAACASNPPFEAARAKALERLGALAGEPLAVRSTYVPVMTVASQLGRADLYEQDTALLVRDEERFFEQLRFGFSFPLDPAKEALVVVSYVRSESTLELRREGGVVHAYAVRTRPCLDDSSAERTASAGREVMVAAVPADVERVELHTAEEVFAPVLPPAVPDACVRDGVVFGGGGFAGALPGAPHALYVNGFSAMTGNVFETRSDDGVAWTPSGWDERRLLSFDDRGPYAGVDSPSPIRIGPTLFLYAGTAPRGATQGGRRLTRFARVEDVRFARGEDVLLPAESGWDDGTVEAPSLIERAGVVSMYYAGGARESELRRIGLATSTDGGRTFVRGGDRPSIGPEAFPYGVSSVTDPDVHVVGDRLEMWCTVWLSGGAPNARLSSAIAHLSSSDGRAWTADPAPLVIPRGDAEQGGLVAPAALVGPGGVTLFATALNARGEPVLERLVCPEP